MQRQSEALCDPPAPPRLGSRELRSSRVDIGCQPLVGGTGFQLIDERLDGVGLTLDHPQYVESDDVARTLPDGVEWTLPEESRQYRFLDIAVPTKTLNSLGHDRRGALANPVLGDRGGQPAKGRLSGIVAIVSSG